MLNFCRKGTKKNAKQLVVFAGILKIRAVSAPARGIVACRDCRAASSEGAGSGMKVLSSGFFKPIIMLIVR